MNREIEFRGLRTDGKGWVYGNLNHYKRDVACIIDYLDEKLEIHEVNPESVGQFTGLLDKNGVKIFEGKNCIRLIIIGLGEGICDVVFENGVFGIYEPSQGFYPLTEALNNDSIIIEVIENIHENK